MAALDGELEMAYMLMGFLKKAPFAMAWHYSAFAAIAVLVWDYLLTFNDELNFFWRGRKSWPAALFFLNRYLPIVAMGFNAVAHIVPPPNDLFCQVWSAGILPWGAAVQICASHTILAARLNAVYGNQTRIRVALIMFLVLTTMGYASVLAYVSAFIKVTSKPLPRLAPDLRICISRKIPPVTWALVPVILFEVVVFSALMRKVLCQLKKDHGSYGFGSHCKRSCPRCRHHIDCPFKRAQDTLLHVILRDNLVYFAIVLGLYITEASLWSTLSLPERGLMDSPTIALVSIMTNRMLINVRRQGEKSQLASSSLGTMTAAADAILSANDRAAAGMATTSEKYPAAVAIPMARAQNGRAHQFGHGPASWHGVADVDNSVTPGRGIRSFDGDPAFGGTSVVDQVVGSLRGVWRGKHSRQYPSTSGLFSIAGSSTLQDDDTIRSGGTAGLSGTLANRASPTWKGKAREDFHDFSPSPASGARRPYQPEDIPFQHILIAVSRQASRATDIDRDSRASPGLTSPVSAVGDQSMLLVPPTSDDATDAGLDLEAGSLYGSLSSLKGPRPRTPSNASSDASMPWHIPEFVTFEDQKRMPTEHDLEP